MVPPRADISTHDQRADASLFIVPPATGISRMRCQLRYGRRKQVNIPGVNSVTSSRGRRTEILDTAADLFASSGLRTSLKDIADACGILPGSLYHHFESKEALIVELVERYQLELNELAKEALEALGRPSAEPIPERVVALGTAIAQCSFRHRAALLLTLYEPPSGAGDDLVRVARRSSSEIEQAMSATLRAGQTDGSIRTGIDLEAMADRLCQTLQHISLGVFRDGRSGDDIPAIRCRTVLHGVALNPPRDAVLDRSEPFAAATRTLESWAHQEEDEDERLRTLRAVARTEFGRRGYEATTVRDIAAAAGLSVGSVYRLIGSKDGLLESIMRGFSAKARLGWLGVLRTDGTAVEKLDALMWININAVVQFKDEFNIQLAWIRESPPTTTNLGSSFSARLGDLKSLLAHGIRSDELRVQGPTADIRAWSLFELLWTPESMVDRLGPRASLSLARQMVLRGAVPRA
jgi:AcrR family transcriptional regulator